MSAVLVGVGLIEAPGEKDRDDQTVVPILRSPASDRASSRGRHPAGGALGDDSVDVEADAADASSTDGVPSERSIAHGLPEGKRWALAAAYERWADLVHGVARQMVGRDGADDVTQIVFVEAWRSRRSFSPDRGEVPGWLVGITRNVARSHVRSLGPRTVEIDTSRDADETSPAADSVIDSLLVANAFRDLPVAQREVLELTLVSEYTQSETAARLDIPLGTVKTRHRRGLETLRRSLGTVRR